MSWRRRCENCGSYRENLGRCTICGEEVCESCGAEVELIARRGRIPGHNRILERDNEELVGNFIVHHRNCRRQLERQRRR